MMRQQVRHPVTVIHESDDFRLSQTEEQSSYLAAVVPSAAESKGVRPGRRGNKAAGGGSAMMCSAMKLGVQRLDC